MMTTMPYTPDRMVRETRVRMRRLSRRAGRVQAAMRAAVLAAVLATLAVGLTDALKGGSEQVASHLAQATETAAVR
jgi:predicted DNA-binding protein